MSVGSVRVGAVRVPFGSVVGRDSSTNVSVVRVYFSGVVTTAGALVVVVVGCALVGAAADVLESLPPHATAITVPMTHATQKCAARVTTTAAPRCRCRRGTRGRGP